MRRHSETTTYSILVCDQRAVAGIVADYKCVLHVKQHNLLQQKNKGKKNTFKKNKKHKEQINHQKSEKNIK